MGSSPKSVISARLAAVTEWWTTGSIAAARPRFRPASVSGTSRVVPPAESEEVVDAADAKPHLGQFGGLFGMVA
jgi:hypothetical protein